MTTAAMPNARPTSPRTDRSPLPSPSRNATIEISPMTKHSAPTKAPSLRTHSGTVLLLRAGREVQVERDEERQREHHEHGERRAQRVVLRLEEQPLDHVADEVDAAAAE